MSLRRLKLPPLLRTRNQEFYKCVAKNEAMIPIDPVSFDEIQFERVFILKEVVGNVIRHYCYDIDTLYDWIVLHNKSTNPTTNNEIENIDTIREDIRQLYFKIHGVPVINKNVYMYKTRVKLGDAIIIKKTNSINDMDYVILFMASKNKISFIGTIEIPVLFLFQTPLSREDIQDLGGKENVEMMKKILTPMGDLTEDERQFVLDFLSNRKNIETMYSVFPFDKELFERVCYTQTSVGEGGSNKKKSLTVKQLQALCKKKGIPYSGLRKAALVKALRS